MAQLPGNKQLYSSSGEQLTSLYSINLLEAKEKEGIYRQLIPERLFKMLNVSHDSFSGGYDAELVKFIAPKGLGLLRIEIRAKATEEDTVFFLFLSDTSSRQIELALCIIADPCAERFYVDKDPFGNRNWFGSSGRNIPEEIRAMEAGLFPNQTRRGLRMFGEFFSKLELFADSLGIEMIEAEPLTYDNAVRYEKYGFDYLTGRRLMMEINREFAAGGILIKRLDNSTPFRIPGMEKTVKGRSWAIYDGILDEPWDDIRIYKIVGVNASINTFSV
jgi:hypothetical protein